MWGGEGFLAASKSRAGRCNPRHLAGMVLLERCDMLMRPMSSGKWERGKQQMRKREIGSDYAISAQFPRGKLPCPICPICTLSPLGVDTSCPGKAGSEGGVPWFQEFDQERAH